MLLLLVAVGPPLPPSTPSNPAGPVEEEETEAKEVAGVCNWLRYKWIFVHR